jgi:hypothetical protein
VIADMAGRDGKHYRWTEDYESLGTAAKTTLDGAWKQTKAYRITGKDTVARDVNQYKIYYAGHVIWGHTYSDSLKKSHTGVGYGTFEMTGSNKLKESLTASTYYEVRGKSFDIDVAMKGTDEFTQTMKEPDGSIGIEVYQRLKK